MRVDVITIFPQLFEDATSHSILRIAREKGILDLRLTDLRAFATDRHRSVDDRPYGGGPGMVMRVEPLVSAIRAVQAEGEKPGKLLLMCPGGHVFDQTLAAQLSLEDRLVLLAPRYEGYDERVVTLSGARKLSVGDYVLTGGELPALIVIDAVTRLIPGVLGDEASTVSESFSSQNEGLLEYPQYTRPAVFEGHEVPEVLLSGNHQKVEEWRREQAKVRTRQQRPDLLNSC